MTSVLPRLRADIQVSVHREKGETFLVLHDVMGFAEGPIMVHSDMLGVLEVCDGETTWEAVATGSEVDPDGPELLKLRSFLGELDQLGFFESEHAERRRKEALDAWSALDARPPVCAGSTYPADPQELRSFLDDMLSSAPAPSEASSVYLIPHIDYRVSPSVYAPAFNAVRASESDLFVMIGTSHYWSDDRIILTEKHFETPIGSVETDRALVQGLRERLNNGGAPSTIAETDLAHKPEHSLELHAVFLRHVTRRPPLFGPSDPGDRIWWGGRPHGP